MDNTIDADDVVEDHIGKAIIEQFFTKTRLTQKQPELFLLGVNNKEVQQPPDLDSNQGLPQEEHITTDDTIPPPPGSTRLGHSTTQHPTPKAMAIIWHDQTITNHHKG
eukprot:2418728-Amphidinium_carterae.1